jgi:peptide-methionine (S)-S-oxide reductase
VGYAGGTTKDPTYHSIGDHSETIQVDYEPTKISYEKLLDVFWQSNNHDSRPYSRQYMSLVLHHNEEQRQSALATKKREEARLGRKLYAEIVPLASFYLAEDYHQKYYLRGVKELAGEFVEIYPDPARFVASTAVARVNGYAARLGTLSQLEDEIKVLGLSPAGEKRLRGIVGR